MANEKRQLVLDILGRSKTREATNETADDLDKLGRKAEETDKKTESLGKTTVIAGKQTEALGKESEDAAKKGEKLGGALEHTKKRISGLDDNIKNLRKEIQEMAIAWTDAGTAAEKNDIAKAMRKTQAELRSTVKQKGILQELIPPEEAKKQGKKAGQEFSANMWQIITPAAVAAAPAIGAVLAGAVIGGVGLGGIAGGLYIASKDPKVQASAKAMKESVANELKTAALPFTDVSIKAIGQLGKAVKDVNFQSIFGDAAKYAGPVIDGIDVLIHSVGKGIQDIVHNAGPVVDVIGKGIGQIGQALGHGLSQLSGDSKQGADALSNLFAVISGGISGVFDLIDGLAKVYGWLRQISHGGAIDGFRAMLDASAPVAGKVRDIAEASVEAVTKTGDLAKAQSDAARAAWGQRDALAAVAKELRAETDPAFAVLDATDKVRDAQKEAADAVKKYGTNSEQARAATRKLAEASIDLQGDVGALGDKFDGHLTPTMRRTLQAAGLTKNQIKAVETELWRAKAAADAYAKRYVAEIITNYTYNVGGNDYNREANRGSFSKRAAGGPVVRGKPYIVGENGPEIVVPSDSGRVLSAAGSRGLMVDGAMTGMQSYGGGGQAREIRLTVDGNDQRLVSLLKYLIRTANLIEA